MTERRPLTPSWLVAGLVALLLIATGFTLLHWHKDWSDQGCQLCHVRHLPSLHSHVAVAYRTTLVSEQDWHCDHSGKELEPSIRSRSSRSPPTTISFAV